MNQDTPNNENIDGSLDPFLPPNSQIPDASEFDSRELRAIVLADRGGIISLGAGVYQCPSQTYIGAVYQMEFYPDTKQISCSCLDYASRRRTYCKHGRALMRSAKAAGLTNLATIPSGPVPRADIGTTSITNLEFFKDSVRRPLPVIKYDKGPSERTRRHHAYLDMDDRSPELLFDLLESHKEPRVRKRGGQRLPREQRAFTVVFRTLWNKPLHDVSQALRKQVERGYIEWAPKPNAISEYVHDPEMTQILEECLARSARVVRNLEKIVCMDSSGISTVSSGNYLDNDRGKRERNDGQWVKPHVISGAKTNMVAKVIVTWNKKGTNPSDESERTADVNFFVDLLRAALQVGWKPKYAAADKAYLSDANVDGAKKLGVQAVIQMKKNSKRRGSDAFKELYDFFTDNPDAHEEIYRYRVKVESVFSALKRTCGHYIWARGPRLPKNPTEADYTQINTSRLNEVLAKFIVHNLRQTVMLEHLYGVKMNYAADTAFHPFQNELEKIQEIREEFERDEREAANPELKDTGS